MMTIEGLTSIEQLAPGEMALVAEINADDVDAARIKRLGICEGRRVQLVKGGDPLIVRVVGTRVGLSARFAARILVRSMKPETVVEPHEPGHAADESKASSVDLPKASVGFKP